MSYKCIPELDFYFRNYWNLRGEITTVDIPVSSIDTSESNIPSGSFIEMLFSQTYDSTSYNHLFTEVEATTFSVPIEERLQYSSSSITPYISTDSTDGENIFSLISEDFVLLNKLSEYRRGKTPDISTIDYNVLTSDLAKLIFIFLDIILNRNYSALNNTDVLATDSVLIKLFELYVINESHKVMKNWSYLIDGNLLELRLVHEVKIITEDMAVMEEVSLEETVYDYDVDVYLNGTKLTAETDYVVMIDSTAVDSTAIITWIVWEDKDADIIEGDTLVVEYYTKVTSGDTGTEVYVDGKEYEEGG